MTKYTTKWILISMHANGRDYVVVKSKLHWVRYSRIGDGEAINAVNANGLSTSKCRWNAKAPQMSFKLYIPVKTIILIGIHVLRIIASDIIRSANNARGTGRSVPVLVIPERFAISSESSSDSSSTNSNSSSSSSSSLDPKERCLWFCH
ncbi:hypothetical protein V1478_006558 [Vespula squamosa]|uniref:Uncharacterized protein n=1 Tax=Vespula squamosa TaxID=30214 RepID=A0ABD2B880_VESSQ